MPRLNQHTMELSLRGKRKLENKQDKNKKSKYTNVNIDLNSTNDSLEYGYSPGASPDLMSLWT